MDFDVFWRWLDDFSKVLYENAVDYQPVVGLFVTYVGAFGGAVTALAGILYLLTIIGRSNLEPWKRYLYSGVFVTLVTCVLAAALVVATAFNKGRMESQRTQTQQAEDLISNGDTDDALSIVNNLLKKKADPHLLTLRCEIMVVKLMPSEAVRDCASVLLRSPNPEKEIAAMYWLGRAKLLQGRYGDARDQFDGILAQEPGYVAALSGRCEARIGQKEFRGAFDDCDEVLRRVGGAETGDPEDPAGRARAMRCEAVIESNMTETSDRVIAISQATVNDCASTVQMRPKSAAALSRSCLAGLEMYRQNGGRLRMEHCEEAFTAATSDPDFLKNWGYERLYAVACLGQRLQGKLEEAYGQCAKAQVPGKPLLNLVQRELCAIDVFAKNLVEARSSCTNAIGADQSSADAFNYRCIAHFWTSDYNRAQSDCDDALRRRPNFALAKKNLCRVLYWQANFPGAAAACADAIQLGLGSTANPEALSYLCRARMAQGQLPSDCATAISQSQSSTFGSGFAYTGQCIMRAAQPSQAAAAEADCTQALQIFIACRAYKPLEQGFDQQKDACPSNQILDKMEAEALTNRAKLRWARQSTDEALADARAARQLDPENKLLQELVGQSGMMIN